MQFLLTIILSVKILVFCCRFQCHLSKSFLIYKLKYSVRDTAKPFLRFNCMKRRVKSVHISVYYMQNGVGEFFNKALTDRASSFPFSLPMAFPL